MNDRELEVDGFVADKEAALRDVMGDLEGRHRTRAALAALADICGELALRVGCPTREEFESFMGRSFDRARRHQGS